METSDRAAGGPGVGCGVLRREGGHLLADWVNRRGRGYVGYTERLAPENALVNWASSDRVWRGPDTPPLSDARAQSERHLRAASRSWW